MDWIGSAPARRDPMPVKQIPAKPPVARSSARRVTIPFPLLSFRGPSVAREPGIHTHRRWLWIPGSRLTARPGMTVEVLCQRDASLIGLDAGHLCQRAIGRDLLSDPRVELGR